MLVSGVPLLGDANSLPRDHRFSICRPNRLVLQTSVTFPLHRTLHILRRNTQVFLPASIFATLCSYRLDSLPVLILHSNTHAALQFQVENMTMCSVIALLTPRVFKGFLKFTLGGFQILQSNTSKSVVVMMLSFPTKGP